MADTEYQIDTDTAFRQASMTADDYLREAIEILDNSPCGWVTSDAVALARVMAMDFHTSMMTSKLQEIRDAIKERHES